MSNVLRHCSTSLLIKEVQIKTILGLAITYKATTNALLQVFVWTYIFITLGYISSSGIAGLHGVYV